MTGKDGRQRRFRPNGREGQNSENNVPSEPEVVVSSGTERVGGVTVVITLCTGARQGMDRIIFRTNKPF